MILASFGDGEDYANEGAEEGGNDYAQEDGGDGEGVNNYLGNDTQQEGNYALQNSGQNALPEEGETLNNSAQNEFASQDPPPMEDQAAVDTSVSDGAEMAASQAMAPVAAPMPGGKVMYVRSTITLFTSPGGAAAGTLEKGDHPLVWTADAVAMAGGSSQMGAQQMPMDQTQMAPMDQGAGYEQLPMDQGADTAAADNGTGNYSY